MVFSGLHTLLKAVAEKDGPLGRIGYDDYSAIDHLPTSLRVSLPILAGDLATLFVEHYSRHAHTITEFPRTLLNQLYTPIM